MTIADTKFTEKEIEYVVTFDSKGNPLDKEHNWLQTIQGKGWYIILRLYGPMEAWFDKTWKPGEIEQLK